MKEGNTISPSLLGLESHCGGFSITGSATSVILEHWPLPLGHLNLIPSRRAEGGVLLTQQGPQAPDSLTFQTLAKPEMHLLSYSNGKVLF